MNIENNYTPVAACFFCLSNVFKIQNLFKIQIHTCSTDLILNLCITGTCLYVKAYLASPSEGVPKSQHLVQPFHVVSWSEDQLPISLGFSVPWRTHGVLCLEIQGSWRSFDVGRQICPKAWMGCCHGNPPARTGQFSKWVSATYPQRIWWVRTLLNIKEKNII